MSPLELFVSDSGWTQPPPPPPLPHHHRVTRHRCRRLWGGEENNRQNPTCVQASSVKIKLYFCKNWAVLHEAKSRHSHSVSAAAQLDAPRCVALSTGWKRMDRKYCTYSAADKYRQKSFWQLYFIILMQENNLQKKDPVFNRTNSEQDCWKN